MMSDYFNTLTEENQRCYLEKINILSAQNSPEVHDPYFINVADCNVDLKKFPRVNYPDIMNYFLFTKGTYTLEEVKAYKSLEAYNQAACGWVKTIVSKDFGEFSLVLGKVMHSQRLNEKLLLPWLICRKSGEVLVGHCDCVAGVGGACTHVAAVLFAMEISLSKLEDVSVTGMKAYWKPPSNKPAVPKRINEIDLRTAKKKFLEENVLVKRETFRQIVPPMSSSEKHQFLGKLEKETTRGCVALSVSFPFAKTIKKNIAERRKLSLMVNYQPELRERSLEELKSLPFNLHLTVDDCRYIEANTRLQSRSKAWFSYRAGRVTASKFKACCRTKINKPSISLIKSICYPSTYNIKAKSLNYGCSHEKKAMQDFLKVYRENHENVGIDKCGLFINPFQQYFAASPDGILECSCCGMSLVEIKCPYCARRGGVMDLIDVKNFYLKFEQDGSIILDKSHTYYYQIQMQLAVTKQKMCYLVVWSKKNMVYLKIKFDEKFWEEESLKARSFFYEVLVMEIKVKYFTKNLNEPMISAPSLDLNEEILESEESGDSVKGTKGLLRLKTREVLATSDEQAAKELFCICKSEDDGVTPFIACDSGYCEIEWYHLKCVNLKDVPLTKWICPVCLV